MSDLARLHALIADRLGAGDRLLLLCDYDGTLTPIVPDPAEARLPEAARQPLETLVRSDAVSVAIVSGRQIEDLRARVGLPGVIYAGCHGLEIDGPGLEFRHADGVARRATMVRLARALEAALSDVPGALVEAKGLSVAIHSRNVPPALVPRIESEVDRAVGATPRVHVLRGKQVLEILPTAGWHKGRCAQRIVQHVRRGDARALTTVYVGDDTTDELAFWTLDGEAVTVRVGPEGPSFATYRLGDPAEVQHLLALLADSATAGSPA